MAFGVVEAIDDGEVVVDGVAEDVDDDGAGGVGAQGRELVGKEIFRRRCFCRPMALIMPAAVSMRRGD